MAKTNLTNHRSNKNLLLCAASVATMAAFGCAAESDNDMASESDADSLALAAPSGSTELKDPNGTYFASVVANGTGCPAGSWQTSISNDGQVFTTTFSQYEAKVDKNKSVDVKNCLISIKLHSPGGLSYAVQEFNYSGYAFLEQGVSARQLATYYFQGAPVTSREARTELKGEFDDTYLFSDVVKTTDAVVWSPCGVDRDLNINTTLRIENSNRKSGYINLAALDGKTTLKFRLAWKKCDGSSSSSGGSSNNGGTSGNNGGSNSGNNGGWNNGNNGGSNSGNNGGWNNGNNGNNGGWGGWGNNGRGNDRGNDRNRPGNGIDRGPVIGGGPTIVGGR